MLARRGTTREVFLRFEVFGVAVFLPVVVSVGINSFFYLEPQRLGAGALETAKAGPPAKLRESLLS